MSHRHAEHSGIAAGIVLLAIALVSLIVFALAYQPKGKHNDPVSKH